MGERTEFSVTRVVAAQGGREGNSKLNHESHLCDVIHSGTPYIVLIVIPLMMVQCHCLVHARIKIRSELAPANFPRRRWYLFFTWLFFISKICDPRHSNEGCLCSVGELVRSAGRSLQPHRFGQAPSLPGSYAGLWMVACNCRIICTVVI